MSTTTTTKEFLLQCQAKNNVFQCNLDKTFRNLACKQNDIVLQYITSNISSPNLDEIYLYFIPTPMLDIVSIERTVRNQKNVFADLDKIYTKHVQGKKNCLMANFERKAVPKLTEETAVLTSLSFNITLLPNQVWIFPQTYLPLFSNTSELNPDFYIYDDDAFLRNILNSAANTKVTFSSNNKDLEKKFEEFSETTSILNNTYLINSFLEQPIAGIGWSEEVANILKSLPKFDINTFKRNITFTSDNDLTIVFPREQRIQDGDTEFVTNFADFAILSFETSNFEIKAVSMKLDSVDFNWYSGGQSQINDEYGSALESKVEKIYSNSWVCQYYDFSAQCEDRVVSFYNNVKKSLADTNRISVFVSIPENTIPYFLPKSEAKLFQLADNSIFIETSALSNVKHGFKTSSYPSSKSLFYNSPFFIVFRAPPSVTSNYFMFKSFTKPNSENCILSMLIYDDSESGFVSQFSPGITLPYLQSLSLNNMLEFYLFDSEKKQVQLSDFSQLFISMKIV
jgi:hypothetical protein